jgi:cAMP-dependent protein kinase regulator
MIKFLKDNYGNRPSINENEAIELNFYRSEVKRLKEELNIGEDEDLGSEN